MDRLHMREMPSDRKDIYPPAVSRWLRPDGWFLFLGKRFKQVSHGRFEFQSNSQPERSYITDIYEAPYCTCWPMGRSPAVPCCHLKTIRLFLKRLKAEQPHTDHAKEDQEERTS